MLTRTLTVCLALYLSLPLCLVRVLRSVDPLIILSLYALASCVLVFIIA